MSVRVRSVLRALVGVIAVVVVASSCGGTVTVRLHARPNGTGTVRVDVGLDAEATRALGEPSEAIATDDLARRGWAVVAMTVGDDGTAAFAVEKSFASPAQANAILDELTGMDGPFHGVRLHRESELLSKTIAVNGSVDLSEGIEAFGDDALAALTGSSSKLGFAPDGVAARVGKPIDQLFKLRLEVDLDGDSSLIALPSGKVTPVSVTHKRWVWEVAAGIAGVVVGLVGLVVAYRHR